MDEINRVARVMVDREPAPDLAARIRERLDEAPPRRAWSPWPIAAGLAAAAVVTAVVWVPGPGSRVLGPESRVQGPESAQVLGPKELAAPKPEAKAGPEVHVASNSRRQPTIVKRAQETRALSAEELAWMERRIPALDPVVALRMDRLATDSIQPEALAITPLTMTALPTTSAAAERRVDR